MTGYHLLRLLLFWGFSTKYCLSSGAVDERNATLLLESINDYFYPDLIQKIKHSYGSAQSNSLINCSQKVSQFWDDLDYEKRAAYFDSFGKVGPGILTGNTIYLGYYDQCIDIGNTDYCRFPFNVTLTANNTIAFALPVAEFGMCFPASCAASDFYHLFFKSGEVIYSSSFNVSTTTYTIIVTVPMIQNEPLCPWRDLEWTTSSIIVLTICILLVVLVLLGTLFDVLLWSISVLPKAHLPEIKVPATSESPTTCEVKHSVNEDEPLINAERKSKIRSIDKMKYLEFLKDLILSFSLYKTVPVIMRTRQSANAITSINGIRVFSMFWIILGHTFVWGLVQNDVAVNKIEAWETVPKRFLFQTVDNFAFSVDSFFLIGGLLLSFLNIREIKRRDGKFPFVYFYIHRLVRLSPTYYFATFFSFKILPYMGSGPLWFFNNVHLCEKYWWANILYINNFYPTNYLDICYLPTWYLANDMQFFIISPIFLLMLYYFWEIGFVAITGVMFTSIAIIGTLAGIRNLHANLSKGQILDGGFPLSNIYEKPYCRINPYLVGLLLGFVLYKKWKVRHGNFWIRVCIYSGLWIIASAVCLTMVFGQYWTWHGHPYNKTENVAYYMFNRTVYSIGIAIMIYLCHNGYGGVVNTFLSWKLWVPLSNLTYTAYLTHPTLLYIMFNTMRFRFIYTDTFILTLAAAAIVLSYSMAFVLAAVVEYPIANVESAVYKFFGIKRRK